MTHERKDGNIAAKDLARTPPSLFKKLDDRFHFYVDAAASKDNHLCDMHMSQELPDYPTDKGNIGNALTKIDWTPRCFTFYCNPPYSRGWIEKFCKKAYEESLKGATVVMLLPADTSTKYYRDYCTKASEIIFIQPRVHFNNPDGTRMEGAPQFGSMVVVFKQEDFDGSPVISCMDWRDEVKQ